MPGAVEFLDDDSYDAADSRTGPDDERHRPALRGRGRLALLAVVATAAALIATRGNDGSREQASPTTPPTPPMPSRVLHGDPGGTVDTSVVRASGACPHPVQCPVQAGTPQLRAAVAAAVAASFGAPTSLEIVSRATGQGAFFSRVVTARTPAGRLLVVAATDDRASAIVVVHQGADTVFARDYRGHAYVNAVLTGPHADRATPRLRHLAADPRLRSTL